jgi:cytoskeleton protein RodZ
MADRFPDATPSGSPAGRSPGALLRAGREAAGMSREDLAARTRLESKLIVALEGDDFARLPQAAFVKGYIRSIARELAIDPAPVLAAYAAADGPPEPELADFATRPPTQITSNSMIVRGATYAIVLTFVVLVVAWWRSDYSSRHAEKAPEPAVVDKTPRDPYPDRGKPPDYAWTIIDGSGGEPLGPPVDERHESNGGDVSVPAELAPGAAETAEPATPAPATAAEPAGKEITIETTEASWVDISDAKRARLYFGMVKPGKPVSVGGVAPYYLVIGNPPHVTLRFRGKLIELTEKSPQGVAKLKLGD